MLYRFEYSAKLVEGHDNLYTIYVKMLSLPPEEILHHKVQEEQR